ncbi:MAG: hypothetical protein P1V81_04610, partial [Planctomycetota bacterium]|nr:hypothetical protein [Planctomycetota bacterium]
MTTLLPLLLALALPTTQDTAPPEPIPITERIWHLGDNETPEWPEGPAAPDGQRIELEFEARALVGEGLLLCQQRHVNNVWHLELNGVGGRARDLGGARAGDGDPQPPAAPVDGP